MTTILILNAASSLMGASYIGVLIARLRRKESKAVVLPLYVTTQPQPHRRHLRPVHTSA
jgi:hypothetical protein